MASVAMTKRSAGYVVPASEWNQLIDNDEACAAAQITTKGDLFVGTGARAGARLAAGANFKGLFANSAESGGLIYVPAGYGSDVYNTDVTIGNSNAENTLRQFSLPANSLYPSSANNVLIGNVKGTYKQGYGGAVTLTLRIKYGTTTLCSVVLTVNSDGNVRFLDIDYVVRANGATNSQVGLIHGDAKGTTAAWNTFTLATATEDSTAAKNVTLTAQWNTAHANVTFTAYSHRALLYAPS